MSAALPEPWNRGPIEGVPPYLQPVAHAFLQAQEEIERATEGLTVEQIWTMPGGVASIGFHLGHLAGSTDRLLTYARGQALTEAQFAVLAGESHLIETRPPLQLLLEQWEGTAAALLKQLRSTSESELLLPREVGRKKLPSTTLGLLYHAGEHAARHTGQMITVSIIVRNSSRG